MRNTLKAEYKSILQAYLEGAGESAIMQAYDFARKCLRNELAPDDVMEFHIDLVEGNEAVKARADALLLEVIMAFSLSYRQALEEVARSNEELERVSRFKSRMLSMVAHDLTNHLTAIRLFASGIARLDDSSDVTKYASYILDVLKDQELLIQNLLDVGRIDSGRMQITVSSQPLRTLIERVVTRMAKTTTQHELRICGPAVQVLADRAKVQQILENVIGNAVKYSPEGGTVDITVSSEHGVASVAVSDHGIGIAAADIPHIFEPFFRGALAGGSEISGTGLGLSIVRSLVQLQGGEITLESRAGEGTTVRFTLPCAPDLAATNASPVEQQAHESPR